MWQIATIICSAGFNPGRTAHHQDFGAGMDVFGLGWLVGLRRTNAPTDSATVFGEATRGLEAFAAGNSLAVEENGRIDVSRDTFWLLLLLGLFGILAATVAIVASYRHFTVDALTEQSREACANTASAALESSHDEIERFLGARSGNTSAQLPAEVDHALHELIAYTDVKRVRIYDSDGRLVYITGADGLGAQSVAMAQVRHGLAGNPSSMVWYQDIFSRRSKPETPKNQAIAWVPLNDRGRHALAGVFEVTTDIGPQVVLQERNELMLGTTILVILLSLYIAFLFSLRAFDNRFTRRQQQLRERANLLPEMYRRSLNTDETEKRRLAVELHEQVAQTLAVVKMNVERAVAAPRGVADASQLLSGVVTPLQSTICEVREVASSLAPTDLLDFGLCAAIENLFRSARSEMPQVEWTLFRDLADEDVSDTMRPVIYRLVEEALGAARKNARLGRFRLLIGTEAADLIVRLRDDAGSADVGDEVNPYSRLREMALLSGGRFLCRRNSWGGVVIRIAWRL
jgi:signal transduction histidine kinase